jgi:hypothetical protein
MEVDLKKTYKTRKGDRVILLGAKLIANEYPIIGKYFCEDYKEWVFDCWTFTGRVDLAFEEQPEDLVENTQILGEGRPTQLDWAAGAQHPWHENHASPA